MAYFYWYFRPWVVLLTIMGILPLENVLSSDPKNLKFRLFRLSHIYHLVVFSVCCYFAVQFSGSMVPVSEPEKNCIKIIIWLNNLRSVLSLLFFIQSYKLYPTVIQLLHVYDKKKENFVIKKKCNRILDYFFWSVCPIIVSFGISCIFSYISAKVYIEISPPSVVQQNWLSRINLICCGYLSSWYCFPNALYLYKALRIIHNYSELNDTLKLTDPNVKIDFETLSKYRYLHNMLSECVYHLSYAYGMFLVIDFVTLVAVVVVNIAVATIIKENNICLLFMSINAILLVVTVLLASEKIKEKGNEVINLLHRMPTKNVSDECLREINTFMLQIRMRPIEISASGYFVLDKRQILNILTQVTTYLIVVCQLVQSYYTSITTTSVTNIIE